jgi:uncharacterized membrane protein
MTRGLAVMLAVGLWAIVPVILAVGCGDDSASADAGDHGAHAGEHDEDVGPDSGATCPDAGSDVTYANFAKDFFSKYCLRCHSSKVTGTARMMAPPDHNFDTLAAIELLTKHIDQKAAAGKVTNEAMPPSDPKPTLAERKKLGEWLACGLPE